MSAPQSLRESYLCKHRTNLCTCKDDISNQLYLPEASGDAGHGEGDQMVQVTIGGSSQLQGSEMDQEVKICNKTLKCRTTEEDLQQALCRYASEEGFENVVD
jgi:hypothetical protein